MAKHPRNNQIAAQAKAQQPHCSNCYKHNKLHAHHVIPLADGGPDTLDNLSVLCEPCHHDWHRYFEGVVSYGEFKALPTVSVLVRIMAKGECDDQTQGEFKRQWSIVQDAYRRTA